MLQLFPSLHGYQRPWLRRDLLAGLTVWAVLVPEALAYATIAGVSPVVGLYAAPGALILYAALGSSRYLVTGPMAATAALSAATVADLVPVGDNRFAAFTAGLALTTGLAALVAGLVRLGFLASFISGPVHRRPDRPRTAGPRPAGHRLARHRRAGRRRHRRDARRLRRGPRRRQELCRPRTPGDRPQPRAARPRRRQSPLHAVQRHGRQRQPLQDRGQRVRR